MQELIRKMFRLINTSEQRHKRIVARYLSLGNAVLFAEFSETENWAILSMMEQLRNYYEQKFNYPLPVLAECVREVV
jgi:hypothetical protein